MVYYKSFSNIPYSILFPQKYGGDEKSKFLEPKLYNLIFTDGRGYGV
jgi:hypothetical protein